MMASIMGLIFNTIAQVFGFLVLLRLLLQLSRASYSNIISQSIIRATEPVLGPIRRIIPSGGALDNAALLVLIAICTLNMAIQQMLAGYAPNLMQSFALGLYKAGDLWLNVYKYSLIIWIVASFIAPGSYHPALALIGQILEPIMRHARRIMPNIGMFDLSPILVFLAIQILQFNVLPAVVNALL